MRKNCFLVRLSALFLLLPLLICCSGPVTVTFVPDPVSVPTNPNIQEPDTNSPAPSRFSNTDATSYTMSFDGSNYFSQKNGYQEAKVTASKDSSIITNWMVSQDYKRIKCTGFEYDLYCGEYMGKAGIEWRDSSSYSFYWFNVSYDGTFRIDQKQYFGKDDKTGKWTNLLKLSSDNSFINKGQFNRISVKHMENNEIKVYVNNNCVYTFIDEQLMFTLPAELAIDFQSKKGETYSPSHSGIARYRFLSFQSFN